VPQYLRRVTKRRERVAQFVCQGSEEFIFAPIGLAQDFLGFLALRNMRTNLILPLTCAQGCTCAADERANPQRSLKPGMFVDVEFPFDLPAALVVPADAIVDSGLRKTVFVDRGNGYFEPRLVETGWRVGDDVEVTKGLMAGDRIVLSGTFFIDSESRMKAKP